MTGHIKNEQKCTNNKRGFNKFLAFLKAKVNISAKTEVIRIVKIKISEFLRLN